MSAARNTKGSAEVAASPSHGSNNPEQENAVNKQNDSTRARASASFIDMDEDLSDASIFASLLTDRIEELFNPAERESEGEYKRFYFCDSDLEKLSFLAHRAEGAMVRAKRIFEAVFQAQRSGPQLAALIEEHRRAVKVLNDGYDAEEERREVGDPLSAYGSLAALEQMEEEALSNLVAWRPTSLKGAAERLRYLLDGPWKSFAPGEVHMNALLSSIAHADDAW